MRGGNGQPRVLLQGFWGGACPLSPSVLVTPLSPRDAGRSRTYCGRSPGHRAGVKSIGIFGRTHPVDMGLGEPGREPPTADWGGQLVTWAFAGGVFLAWVSCSGPGHPPPCSAPSCLPPPPCWLRPGTQAMVSAVMGGPTISWPPLPRPPATSPDNCGGMLLCGSLA